MTSILDARDALDGILNAIPFPAGDSPTDTIIGGVHFNKTILERWDYHLFENQTLSNVTWCLLAFPPYTPPVLLDNGTWLNVTWCWHPVYHIGVRAGVGLGFASAFGLGIVAILMNLHKHGKLYLPVEKRFWPIGRRWQWYWCLWVCATAIIASFTGIDVDRYYLPELPIILTSFFWYIMQLGSVAAVWEAVRHWGSWMERQYIDPDPFRLRIDDRRSKVEFWLPLSFYLFWWLNFFMIVPRNWGKIQLQRYPQQVLLEAEPGATDARFKAGAFFLLVCWFITAFSLRHSIKHYRERNRGIINKAVGLIKFTPPRFLILLPLSLAVIAFQILCSFKFDYSPLKLHGNKAAIFVGGYLPSLLIVIVMCLFGWLMPNEDRELQRQRRERGRELDREMGIVHKPRWWRLHEEFIPGESMQDRIARNVAEVGGRKPANGEESPETQNGQGAANNGEGVEMDSIQPAPPPPANVAPPMLPRYSGKSEQRRVENAQQLAAGLLFPDSALASPSSAASRSADLMMDGPPPTVPPPPPYAERTGRGRPDERPPSEGRSRSADTSNSTNRPPQQIRSMLDV